MFMNAKVVWRGLNCQVSVNSVAEGTHSFLWMSSEVMKSLASSDMEVNASSSKSNSARVMLAKVSASLSPIKGERPDNLGEEEE